MYLFYKLQIEPKALKFCGCCVTELAYRLGAGARAGGGAGRGIDVCINKIDMF